MQRPLLFVAAILPLAVGCRRSSTTSEAVAFTGGDAASSRASASPEPPPPPPPREQPSASATPEPNAEPQQPPYVPVPAAERVVRAWNDALDKHTVDKLAPLYGDPVLYYRRSLPRAAVVTAKTQALAGTSYRQQIVGEIGTYRAADGNVRATFTKRSGPADQPVDVEATLILRGGHGAPYVIVEETDEITEGDAPTPACEAAASRAVNSLPQVKRVLAQAMADADDAGAAFGGTGAMPDDDKGFTSGMGFHTSGRYEEIIGWTVNRDGELTVTLSDGEDAAVPPATSRAVARVCKH